MDPFILSVSMLEKKITHNSTKTPLEISLAKEKLALEFDKRLALYKKPNKKTEGNNAIEREISINGLKIHLKSVFTRQTKLDAAMNNIIRRRLSDTNH